MTLYAIFDPKPGTPALPVAVPEQFSWAAAILPPAFLLRHGLWLEALLWFVIFAALVFLGAIIGGEAAFWLYVLKSAWIGFAAPDLHRHALRRRGWHYRGDRIALSADLAQLEAIR